MNNKIDVIIKPVTVRFSLFKGEIYYLFTSAMEAQLDDAERFMGIDPKKQSMIQTNLGFLPVCSTVLIRGEKTILVDPNNHHIGFYGLLAKALQEYGVAMSDIDVVVATHMDHDHAANLGMFKNCELVVGKGELDSGRMVYGNGAIQGRIENYSTITEVEDTYEIMPGVVAIFTPGHSAGSISLFVEGEDGKTVVAGDSIMTKNEWTDEDYSHWYSEAQLEGLKEAARKFREWKPDRIIPGHDQIFEV